MDINHIHNHHDDFSTPTIVVEENFSMSMDHHHLANEQQQQQQHHHHFNPITPYYDQQVWSNNHHTSSSSPSFIQLASIPSSSSTLFSMKPTLHRVRTNTTFDLSQNVEKGIMFKPTLQLTNENEIDKEDEDEKEEDEDEEEEELGPMKEMMYRYAVMQPVDIDPATIHKPKRRNVRISSDPQSVAARHRRERISEKIRVLQRLVPGGTKMDTASMLDEAIRYVKFLKKQIRFLQRPSSSNQNPPHVPLSLVDPNPGNSNDQRQGNIVLMRDRFNPGIVFHHQGN